MIRKVHLDYHTHPDTPGIGAGFDPEAFADTLAAAGVNCLATPGKCHFGHVYYAAQVAKPHPHLARPDLFPATVQACRRRGIVVQAYWTLGLDSRAAAAHPEWRQRFADGHHASWGHYLHMCFASPYVEEQVLPELAEAIELCPGICGFWFDICLHLEGAYYSEAFERAVSERLGEQAGTPGARWRLARELISERCARIEAFIAERLPGAENYFNTLAAPGLLDDLGRLPVEEVENPIRFQGPEKMSCDLRWLRGRGVPALGLTSRFLGPWSDPGTIRTEDQMRFDVGRTLALGGQPSMGDHRRPDGSLESEVYRRLAPVYNDLAACEEFLVGALPCADTVLLGELTPVGEGLSQRFSPRTQQAVRLLAQAGRQGDLLGPDDPLPGAALVVWPGWGELTEARCQALSAHVSGGGAVLALGPALSPAGAEVLGLELAQDTAVDGPEPPPTDHFLRPSPELGLAGFAWQFAGEWGRLGDPPDQEVLADRCPPCSQLPSFADRLATGPAIVQRGHVIGVAVDLFAAEAAQGGDFCRELLAVLAARLAPPVVTHDGGPSVVASLHRTHEGFALHVVHWAGERRPGVVDVPGVFPPLGPLPIGLRLPQPILHATLEPSGEELACRSTEYGVDVTLPAWRVHALIALRTHG